MDNTREIQTKLGKRSAEFSKRTGDAGKAFEDMINSNYNDGPLDKETIELVLLGMAIVKQCKPCILAHARKASELKISPEKIDHVSSLAVQMNGGPGRVYGSFAAEVYRDFLE